jgi:hypothetical protein
VNSTKPSQRTASPVDHPALAGFEVRRQEEERGKEQEKARHEDPDVAQICALTGAEGEWREGGDRGEGETHRDGAAAGRVGHEARPAAPRQRRRPDPQQRDDQQRR